ncbi:hypothetical protein Sinac_4477 [Singulisphaera acidiphila DSM 18658]|uniref:Uncharacterized protein n=1 Tax=Singulisphaera acidiphila (strain ATCC BAA-1392 / DSM 18658 / VKM B-2454 / MOB10) TaxID=886293 RepID=L0DIH8_SINAD|nr:hypothetical protein Sinac_4477 [Singulisphaera acidiphila DSM 18658]
MRRFPQRKFHLLDALLLVAAMAPGSLWEVATRTELDRPPRKVTGTFLDRDDTFLLVFFPNLTLYQANPTCLVRKVFLKLPLWSSDLTPIEEMFSKVKGAMRTAAARTTEAVYAAFGSALHDVPPEIIAEWFEDRAAYAM